MWRASRLGLDFSVGSPVSMRDRIVRWWKDIPDKCFFIESIVIMWIIWCRRNAFLFRHIQDPPHLGLGEVDHLLANRGKGAGEAVCCCQRLGGRWHKKGGASW